MVWIEPKTDWDTDDGIMADDLNRIEGNIKQTNDCLSGMGFKRGIEYYANNTIAGGSYYNIKVKGGAMYSQSAVEGPMVGSFNIQKVLSASTWTEGNSTSSPCRVDGANSIGANQWWYVFVLYNPTTETFDVCMDSDSKGANISGSDIETVSGFTMWKRVAYQFELGLPISLAPRLWNTVGMGNYFYIHELSTVTGSSTGTITSGVVYTKSLIGITTGSPIVVPPSEAIPVLIEITPNSAGIITIWSNLHGSTYAAGAGEQLFFTSANEKKKITIIPDTSDQINAYTTTITSYTFNVCGWIDEVII